MLKFVILLLLPLTTFSQTSPLKFQKLSSPEKWWVVTHLFVATKAKRITEEARIASKQMEKDTLLDGDADGGQVDAFRHSFWMARLSQEMCWRKAMKLGMAHEKGNYKNFKKHRYEENTIPDSAASAMDLFNNQIGLETGCMNRAMLQSELRKLLIEKILSGKMKIILKDEQRHSLDCKGIPINMNSDTRKWNIPRCIIDSNRAKQ